MALFGLFGGNKNESKTGDFFLEFEDAQTLGDTEYMKQPKTIKRTFPKLKGNQGKTIVTQVSAENMRDVDPNTATSRVSSFAPAETSSAPAETPAETFQPRPNLKVDGGMDMFRNMAKKINR
jgi:hypothetical protein